MDRTPVHFAVLAIVEDATTGDLSSANVAIERAIDLGHKAVAQDLASTEPEVRAQITRWIGQPHIDAVVVVGDDRGATKAALAPLVTEALTGFANVWAVRCSSKLVFVLPPTPGAARSAMDTTVLPKLDSRRSDSLVKLLPRLAQPRGKPKTGKNVVKRGKGDDDDFDPPTKPIDVEGLERQIAMSSAENPTRQVDLAKLTSMAADSSDDDGDEELALQKPKRPAFVAAKTTIAIPPATPKPQTTSSVPKVAAPPPVPARATLQTPPLGTPIPPPAQTTASVPKVAAPPPPPPTDRIRLQTPPMGAPAVKVPPAAPPPAPPPAKPVTVAAPPPPPTPAAAPPPAPAPVKKPPIQTPPLGAPIPAAPAVPTPPPVKKPPIQTPPMGAPIPAAPPPPPAPEPRRTMVQTPPMPTPVVKPPEPKHVVLVSSAAAADPSDRGWTQPMEPIAKTIAPMPTDPGWTQPLPVDRNPPAPPRAPMGTPSLPDGPPAVPPRRTPAVGVPAIERDGEITDVLPVPPPPAPAPKRPTIATPPAGIPVAPPPPPVPPAASMFEGKTPPPVPPTFDAKTPPPVPPSMFEGKTPPPPPPVVKRPTIATPPVGLPATPPPSMFEGAAPPPNLWDTPENAGAVPQPMAARPRADKTMMVRIPGRGPSKGVIALLLFAAACAVAAAVVVVMKHGKTVTPDAGVAIAKPPVVAQLEVDAAVAEPDANEPDIDMNPVRLDAGVGRAPPTHVEPTHVAPTHVEPTRVEPTHVEQTHIPVPPPHSGSAGSAGSATPAVTPIEPARPLPPGPPPEPGCDEVSCVLDRYARPCCARYKPADSGFDPKKTMPDRLDRAAVKEGVEHMKPRVIACNDKTQAKGTVKLSITVAPNGTVSDVNVDETPDAGLGQCVAAALRKATFGKSINGASFVYPFVF